LYVHLGTLHFCTYSITVTGRIDSRRTDVGKRRGRWTRIFGMGNLFGKEIPLKDQIKENKRIISRAIRELDRERTRMEREEKKLIADIKKMAAQGQMKAVQIQAKELVRTRNFITKFLQMRAHLNAVSLKIQTIKSHEAVYGGTSTAYTHTSLISPHPNVLPSISDGLGA